MITIHLSHPIVVTTGFRPSSTSAVHMQGLPPPVAVGIPPSGGWVRYSDRSRSTHRCPCGGWIHCGYHGGWIHYGYHSNRSFCRRWHGQVNLELRGNWYLPTHAVGNTPLRGGTTCEGFWPTWQLFRCKVCDISFNSADHLIISTHRGEKKMQIQSNW